MTQADLAIAAGSSTRHLSCLETGRSQPSREMIVRLAEHLEIPLRDQNALLLAAGFAPAFQERSLAELAVARTAIEQILQAHKPYPAFAVDRHWNVVLSNSALPQLYEGCSPDLLRRPINAVRLTLHPLGMGPRIENFVEWRAHTVAVLRQQLDARADPVIRSLLAEVTGYPAPAEGIVLAPGDTPQCYATPLKIATRLGTVSSQHEHDLRHAYRCHAFGAFVGDAVSGRRADARGRSGDAGRGWRDGTKGIRPRNGGIVAAKQERAWTLDAAEVDV